MKKLITFFAVVAVAILGVLILKSNPSVSGVIWRMSDQGSWLMPLVFFSALLDSIHPCSFSILLVTIAFLFGMSMTRRRIIQVGGMYIFGIFTSYFLIGLGILKVLHLFNTPHFMGRLGAGLLIIFGVINILNAFFPRFPVKLQLPHSAHTAMSSLINRASIVAAFGLGLLVGICQFPCMGGPYLMVIGLLRDQSTYFTGFSYLLFYNAILILPLAAVLYIAADKTLAEKIQGWQQQERKVIRWVGGILMILLGLLIYIL